MTATFRARTVSIAALAVAMVACSEDAADHGTRCEAVIWSQADRAGAELSLVGSWNGWGVTTPMRSFASDPHWKYARVQVDAGDYGYLVVEEGEGRLDRYNAQSTFRASDEHEVSLLRVESCATPRVHVTSAERVDAAAVDFELRLIAASDDSVVDPTTMVTTAIDGTVQLTAVDADAGTAMIRVRANTRGKHRVAVTFEDEQQRRTEPRELVTWGAPVAETWSDGILYQVMIDRFRGDDGVALSPPPTPGSRAGGTLGGVTSALRDGYFAALGVSALWLSPVYENPVEAREGRDDDHLYEGYHGYWPLDSRAVDARIGGEAALHELVSEAHAQGIAVLLDLVPNHLYEDNPRVADGRVQGWFHEHDEPCVCGSPTCSWATYIQTCWFTPYLPDLRFENDTVMNIAVADALWWHQTFDTDGFRIDAVPMMPRAASRRIAHALREATAPRDTAFTIGEIFTGAGRGGTDGLRYHLGPDGLDSAFDFPLMWALRDTIALDGQGFAQVEASLAYTDLALAGSGAQMQLGRMIGNHDVTRFASEVAGDADGDPWTDPPPQPTSQEVYLRQRLALGLVLTLPGLPVLYYGDELALAGAADPDSRRVLPALAALGDEQAELLAAAQALAQARRCMPALRRGTRVSLVAGDTHYAFVRDASDGAPALVIASRADTATELSVSIGSAIPSGRYTDLLGGAAIDVASSTVTVSLPAWGLAVFVPDGHACTQ